MKTRIYYLDALRCAAAVLVIVLHAATPYQASTAAYGKPGWVLCLFLNPLCRCGVPLFLMISGRLLLGDPASADVAGFYKKRLPRLVIPLLFWSAVYYVATALYHGAPLSLGEFLAQLADSGTSYHMWYIYQLLGLYLLTPFLRCIVAQCTAKQLWVLLAVILFPTTVRPLLNTVLPIYLHLFGVLVEGYAGYYLLGYLLGAADLKKGSRVLIYCLGLAGFAAGVLGNLLTAGPEEIPLPMNGGYHLVHFLCAAALFTLARQVCRDTAGARVRRWTARLAGVTFGVYWVHPMALALCGRVLSGLSLVPMLLCQPAAAALLSFAVMLPLARVPWVRKLIQ